MVIQGKMMVDYVSCDKYPNCPIERYGVDVEIILPNNWHYDNDTGDISTDKYEGIGWIEIPKRGTTFLKAHYKAKKVRNNKAYYKYTYKKLAYRILAKEDNSL